MSGHKGGSQLEVDEDLEFQRRDWIFERAGWVALVLVLIAACAGLFGRGPLSDRSLTAPDGSARVDWARFERHGSPAEFTLTVFRRSPVDTTTRVWLDEGFVAGITLDRVIPQPVSEATDGGRLVLEIPTPRGVDSTRVIVRFTPDRIGERGIRLGIAGAAALRLDQFVYP